MIFFFMIVDPGFISDSHEFMIHLLFPVVQHASGFHSGLRSPSEVVGHCLDH